MVTVSQVFISSDFFLAVAVIIAKTPHCFAEDGTDLFISACRTLFFGTRPIKFLICGVVVAVPSSMLKLLLKVHVLKCAKNVLSSPFAALINLPV